MPWLKHNPAKFSCKLINIYLVTIQAEYWVVQNHRIGLVSNCSDPHCGRVGFTILVFSELSQQEAVRE